VNAGFPKQVRLTDAKDFRQVFAGAKRIAGAHLVLLYRCNELDFSRLGLAISKKHLKTAVKRNSAKRLVREYFRLHQDEIKGLDIIVLSRAGLESACKEEIRQALERLWWKLNKQCAT
jgi:ribonuclease P protein component